MKSAIELPECIRHISVNTVLDVVSNLLCLADTKYVERALARPAALNKGRTWEMMRTLARFLLDRTGYKMLLGLIAERPSNPEV